VGRLLPRLDQSLACDKANFEIRLYICHPVVLADSREPIASLGVHALTPEAFQSHVSIGFGNGQAISGAKLRTSRLLGPISIVLPNPHNSVNYLKGGIQAFAGA